MADQEFTPRELGLLSGHAWAKSVGPAVAREAADGHLPDGTFELILDAGMGGRLEEFGDPAAAHEEFWGGFTHGVRAFVVEDLARASKLN